MVLSKLMGALGADLAIDLGTGNTHVCVRGRGLVLSEPTVLAVKRGTDDVLMDGAAVGRPAKDMIGRTPETIDAVRPVREGVIADFDMAEALLLHFIRRAVGRASWRGRWLSPRILFTTPYGISAVAKRAIFNAAERAGARKVFLLEEPRAAGIGADVPIHEARAHMVVDVGAGTTDISVLSLADVVVAESLRIAGDAMDSAIVHHLKDSYNILVGDNPAEAIKIELGSACSCGEETRKTVRGRDLITGLPRAVTVTSEEIREAIAEPVRQILQGIRNVLERTGPDLSGDLLETGVLLCGGGVLLRGLPDVIGVETGLPVTVAEDPLRTVARGAAKVLDHLDEFKGILESDDDDV